MRSSLHSSIFMEMSIQRSETPAAPDLAGFLADVLDHFAIGVVILDRTRQIQHMNAAAQRMFEIRDGLEVRDLQVRTTDPVDQEELDGLITRALRIRERWRKSCAGLVTIHRQLCERPLHLCVARVRSGSQSSEPAAALLISSETTNQRQSLSLLRELYGLTPSESMLAAELLKGKSMEESAAALKISIMTARSHLKKVFAKTGTNRQSQLLWLLTTGLGALDLDL